ncbi:MAG TPA: glycosyltransferase [Terriglobales bacterium]|nr:glycosyltransferase [Terriglobales bacterium]
MIVGEEQRCRLTLVYFDAGGGHRAATHALASVIRSRGLPWDTDKLNLQELLDHRDPLLRYGKIRMQDVYNRMLERGWTLGSGQLLKALHAMIRAQNPVLVRDLCAYWSQARPHLVVSLVPNFNAALARSVHQAIPGVLFGIVMTDLADYPPHFWMERETDFLICGSDRAVEQARALGLGESSIMRVSGMILNPRFYVPMTIDRRSARHELGLDEHRPTALVLFGGYGSKKMLEIAARLERCESAVQAIFICGRNKQLADELRARRLRIPHFVEEFTSEIPRYMAMSDFLIGKPGPGCISEAIHMQLPVVVADSAWTLPQERFNVDWVVQNGVGIKISAYRQITSAVDKIIDRFPEYHSRAAAMQNRAVFEVVECLQSMLARSGEVRAHVEKQGSVH